MSFNISEERQKSLKALSSFLKNEKNYTNLEKYIYESTTKEPEIYKWCVYQIIGMLLNKNLSIKEIACEVKKGNIGWKNQTYDTIRKKIEEYDDYLVKPFEVVEGVVQCGKCHSRKTWSVQKQTRGGDEPMTTFSKCVECGNQWSYSG